MRRALRPMLRRAVALGDALASRGGGRVVAERDLGLAYGESLLRRAIALLGVDLVVDIGANRGQFVRHLRHGARYRGRILSLEPGSAAFAELARKAARDPRWQVRRAAVAGVSGTVDIHIMRDDQFSSALTPSATFADRFEGRMAVVATETVEAITLAEALAAVPPWTSGLLKLDTQGTELAILGAAGPALDRFGAVLVEVGFARLYEGEPAFEETRTTMAQLGFTLSGLFPNNHGHFPTLVQMDALFVRTERIPALT